MNDSVEAGDNEYASLRERAETLERELAAAREEATARLIHAEMKAEAVRAGMVDLDGLKLLDLSALSLNEGGDVAGGAAAMLRLRRDKPWLFAGASSSSTVAAPRSTPVRAKLATEMTLEEWRAARAEILRHR